MSCRDLSLRAHNLGSIFGYLRGAKKLSPEQCSRLRTAISSVSAARRVVAGLAHAKPATMTTRVECLDGCEDWAAEYAMAVNSLADAEPTEQADMPDPLNSHVA